MVEPTDDEQRKGRGGRDGLGALHLILYEPWVLDIKIEEFDDKNTTFSDDPDRPWSMLKKGSNKRERLPRSGLESILAPCIRQYRAEYFGNCSSTRKYSLCFSTLSVINEIFIRT